MAEVLPFRDMGRSPAPEGERTCRACGCWEYRPCSHEILGECWWTEADLCSHCDPATFSEDPLDGHFASCLMLLKIPLWRWRLDVALHRIETGAGPDEPRGWEIAVHFWRMRR